MIRRLPLWPTLIVAAAVATMIVLGIWQLQRAAWKEGLLHRYAQASGQPPVFWPNVPVEKDAPLFRRSSLMCLSVTNWRSASGRNVQGTPGWVLIATCRTGAEGPGAQVVAGWATRPDPPKWTGGMVSGTIAPDSRHILRLVSGAGLGGLAAPQPPSLDDVPNNHMAYAVQWFLFAAVAAIIYLIAVARRPQPPGDADAAR